MSRPTITPEALAHLLHERRSLRRPFRRVREIFIDQKPTGYDLAGDHPRWTEAETFERLTPPAD